MPLAIKTLRPRGQEGAADRAYEARRQQAAWRAWYKTARWRAVRAEQLNREPLCRTCTGLDIVTPASVCDHVRPHRGDEALFWSGPFQSLCPTCHSAAKQRDEAADRRR